MLKNVLVAGAVLAGSATVTGAQTQVNTTIPDATRQQVAAFEAALKAGVDKATGSLGDRAREVVPDIVMRYQVGLEVRSFILPTDGSYSFSRSIEDFSGAASWFTGLAADADGIAWVGTWTQFTSTGSTLIRLDASTGDYTMFEHDLGWPFPGEHVRPLAITPDGRLWLHNDIDYPSPDSGLCWYDG